MSSLALPEAWPPDVAAKEIDHDFQLIADKVPREAKLAASRVPMTLLELEGVGKIHSMYMGNFAMALVATVDSYGDDLGLIKDYNLREHWLKDGGVLYEARATTPEDIADYPWPVTELVCTLQALRQEFVHRYGEQREPASVTHIDDWRNSR